MKVVYSENWEDINIICPNQCICQYLHLKDLSIARWISIYNSERQETDKNITIKHNEESDDKNEKVKLAMCMLQSDFNAKNFILSLPQDIEALVLLYTGTKDNLTG